MGLLGKILAIVNVIVAVAFVIVLTLDYGQRQRWSFACLEQDFQLNGLPVDSEELTEEGIPKVDFVTDKVRRDLFAAAPGAQVRTQVEEIDSRKNVVMNTAGDDVSKLRDALMPLAETTGARDELHAIQDAATLKTRLAEAFDRVRTNRAAPMAERRDEIARVLFATSTTPEQHNRTLAVVGLKEYCQAANVRTVNCQNMIPSYETDLANDRNAFVVARKDLMQQISAGADRNQDLESTIAANTLNLEQNRTLVQRRKEVVAALQKEIAQARQAANAAIASQTKTEQETFAAEKAVTDAEAKNRELLQTLSGLENNR